MNKRWIIFVVLSVAVVQLACSALASGDTAAVQEELAPTAVMNVPEVQVTEEPRESQEPQEESSPRDPSTLDVEAFGEVIDAYVLRPDDLPNDYKVLAGGESHLSNAKVLQRRGEVAGKRYIIATGRLDGWTLQLERRKKADIAPYYFESRIELFETPEGARLAISPEWYPVYAEGATPPDWVSGGCDLGDECLFYFYENLDPATELTTLSYHVAFTYKNVLVWLMGRGLDIDVKSDYVLNAALSLLNKLEASPLVTR